MAAMEFIVFKHLSEESAVKKQPAAPPPKNVWSEHEIALLTEFILQNGEDFKRASAYLKEQTGIYKSPYYCSLQYYNKRSTLKRGRWSTAELERLYEFVRENKSAEEIQDEFARRTIAQLRNKMRQFQSEDSS